MTLAAAGFTMRLEHHPPGEEEEEGARISLR
jgi:hypothetical protein